MKKLVLVLIALALLLGGLFSVATSAENNNPVVVEENSTTEIIRDISLFFPQLFKQCVNTECNGIVIPPRLQPCGLIMPVESRIPGDNCEE